MKFSPLDELGRPLRVLSLGAGVQSTAVLLLSIDGLLPQIDAAVFADTQWEPPEVYEHLENLESIATIAERNVPIHRVSAGDLREHTLKWFVGGEGGIAASLPLYVRSPDGAEGIIRRQCTETYKIRPIDRFIRYELLGLDSPQARAPAGSVDLWMGISADEIRRARDSRVQWRRNVYPLIGMPEKLLPHPMRREDCIKYVRDRWGFTPPRSACMGCPFKTNAEWRRVKADPEQWENVVEVDRAIRHADRMKGEVFLHNSRVPLEEVDLRDQDERTGQMKLFGVQEDCMGYCET